MELSWLHSLLAVMDGGSLQEAARRLGTSRTTLRQHLDALEAELGLTLLVRSHHGATPTTEGEAFAEQARALLLQARALANFRSPDAQEPEGVLRVRGPLGMPRDLIQVFLRFVATNWPKLRLVMVPMADPLQDLSVDVDVVLHFGPAPPSGPFRTFTLLQAEEHLLASEDWVAEHGMPGAPEELDGVPLLMWMAPGDDGQSLPLLSGATLPVKPLLATPEIHLLRTLIANGLGVGFVPDSPLAAGVPGERLVPVLEGVVGRTSAVRVLIPDAAANNPTTRAVLALLRRLAAGELPGG